MIEANSTESIARAYATAWATVLPGFGEAFGLVLIESLASGTPVVTARTGGPPEIVNGDRIGRLFEPGDAVGLAHALEETLELSHEPDVTAACRKRAAEFDWARVVEEYEGVYESVGRRGRQRAA